MSKINNQVKMIMIQIQLVAGKIAHKIAIIVKQLQLTFSKKIFSVQK
jgi:hypothetical protein